MTGKLPFMSEPVLKCAHHAAVRNMYMVMFCLKKEIISPHTGPHILPTLAQFTLTHSTSMSGKLPFMSEPGLKCAHHASVRDISYATQRQCDDERRPKFFGATYALQQHPICEVTLLLLLLKGLEKFFELFCNFPLQRCITFQLHFKMSRSFQRKLRFKSLYRTSPSK